MQPSSSRAGAASAATSVLLQLENSDAFSHKELSDEDDSDEMSGEDDEALEIGDEENTPPPDEEEDTGYMDDARRSSISPSLQAWLFRTSNHYR
jgi:hypothetical protein